MEIEDILEEDLLEVFSEFESQKEIKKVPNEKINREKEINIDPIEENFAFEKAPVKGGKILEIDSSNVDSFALLLKELLNNKTIEITIKLKENK